MRAALTEIVASALNSIAWEMCASLIRTAFSPNVKERADCSVAICDIQGRTLALAAHAPAHLGSTLLMVPALLERFPLERMREGDVFIANDPYIVGVTHLNDVTVAAPVFFGGRVVAFTAAVAHHSDVGGRVPGSESGDSTSIFQEGLRLPPMLLFAASEKRADVWEMVLLNSRTPHFNDGDLHAQIAANTRGRERLTALIERHGEAVLAEAIAAMLVATERRTAERINSVLRPGTYSAEDWLDDDGATGAPVRLAVTLHIADGHVGFDFSACSAQIASGKNVPYTHLMATVYYCLKSVLDPDLPINEGFYRAVSVTAPVGSVVNPTSPSGVSSRNLTSMILADAILNAFGQAAPAQSVAASGPYQGIILSGQDNARGRYFVDYENFAGGHGADADHDGADVMQMHMTNTSNLPIEVMELEFPVRVERYEMITDSGGAGRRRGGLGVQRDLRMTAPGILLANRSARQVFPALGLEGGGAGSPGLYTLNPDTAPRRLAGTLSEYALAEGDLLRVTTPGGGGHGAPSLRDPADVLADVLDGRVSRRAAAELYCVVLAGCTVDVAATAALRRGMAP